MKLIKLCRFSPSYWNCPVHLLPVLHEASVKKSWRPQERKTVDFSSRINVYKTHVYSLLKKEEFLLLRLSLCFYIAFWLIWPRIYWVYLNIALQNVLIVKSFLEYSESLIKIIITSARCELFSAFRFSRTPVKSRCR